jgi:hypothetical protein
LSGGSASFILDEINMRNPHHWRNIGFGFFVSGWVTSVAAFLLPGPAAADWVRTCLFIYGTSAIIFGGGTALFRHFDARAKEALGRGENIITRWRVDAATWHELLRTDRQLGQNSDALPNELSIPDAVQEDGIEVIVGKDAVQVDQSIHRLPRRGPPEIKDAILHDCQPAVVELRLYYPGGWTGASGIPHSSQRTALRFPVGADAGKEATIVTAHFRGDTPGKPDFFHRKGDGSDLEDLSKCYHCGYETYRFLSHCPQCGSGIQSKRWSRRFGGILFVLGLFISVVMGWTLYATIPMFLHPSATSGGTRFSGTPEQGRLFLGILGAVELFGVTTMCYGLWQVVTGRRSKWVIYFAVGLGILLFLTAIFI